MTSITLKRLAPAAALLAATSLAGGAAFAQGYSPPGTPAQSFKEDPATALTRHLRDLNSSPRSLTSLLGAGQAALDVGDPQAALTFFARAEQVAPRDGRVKAGMGSAFVQTEQAQPALQFFAEAVSSGAPLSLFAKDRGLAYDMIGDPVRAQADYAFALQRGSDPEVERRMALSKAIVGDRKAALAILDPQLRRGDRAGWRARAFVLALTGDAAGAVQAARAAMPTQAGAMGPFFARLPQLSAADRAMAVHFGRFPLNWQASAAASNTQYAQNQAALPTTAGHPGPSQPALGTRTRAVAPNPIPQTKRPPPAVSPAAQASRVEPSAQAIPSRSFDDVVAAVESLPAASAPRLEEPARLAQAMKPKSPPTKPAAKPAAKPETKPAPEKKAPPPRPIEPSRVWVQLAVAQDKSAFPFEFKRLKAKAPELLTGKSAWTAPMGKTNRLLVGPFKTANEARLFVNQLTKEQISSFSWESDEGQKVEKLPPK